MSKWRRILINCSLRFFVGIRPVRYFIPPIARKLGADSFKNLACVRWTGPREDNMGWSGWEEIRNLTTLCYLYRRNRWNRAPCRPLTSPQPRRCLAGASP
jgi:hypothetical protein